MAARMTELDRARASRIASPVGNSNSNSGIGSASTMTTSTVTTSQSTNTATPPTPPRSTLDSLSSGTMYNRMGTGMGAGMGTSSLYGNRLGGGYGSSYGGGYGGYGSSYGGYGSRLGGGYGSSYGGYGGYGSRLGGGYGGYGGLGNRFGDNNNGMMPETERPMGFFALFQQIVDTLGRISSILDENCNAVTSTLDSVVRLFMNFGELKSYSWHLVKSFAYWILKMFHRFLNGIEWVLSSITGRKRLSDKKSDEILSKTTESSSQTSKSQQLQQSQSQSQQSKQQQNTKRPQQKQTLIGMLISKTLLVLFFVGLYFGGRYVYGQTKKGLNHLKELGSEPNLLDSAWEM